MTSAFRQFLIIGVMILQCQAEPLITEFMADNQTTLADEDGDFSDWIELHNPTASPIDLGGWSLTDSAKSLTKWTMPPITLQPGEFRIIFASQKTATRVDHANFKLAKDGEYLALVRPDGTIRQQFAPAFPAQATDESYGLHFNYSTLVAAGANARYTVPTGPLVGWQAPGFDDSAWPQGPTGLGFGLTEPGITVRQVSKNGTINGLADTYNLLSLPPGHPGILSEATAVYPTLNLLGEGGDGHFPYNSSPPGGGGDNYAIEATGFIHIPTAGYHTFGLNSDDGGAITIDGVAVMVDDSFHAAQDFLGTVYLTAGQHSFRVVMFEGGGGDEVEFYSAAGQFSAWNDAFRLVGDRAAGGLAATTQNPGASSVIGTNLQAAMAGQSTAYARIPFTAAGAGDATAASLVMRYNDGFAAWLNGSAAASDRAPAEPWWNATATASRPNDEALRRTAWNLTSLLPALADGTNLLAIQGLNASADDPSFLILPELIIGSVDETRPPAFFGSGLATPGWINGAFSVLGKVADTRFSVKRGVFSAPFELEITTATPTASIRYTTDGSLPTATHGSLYTAPLTIAATTNLRAVGFLDDWESTNVDTQTYLFPADIIRQQPYGAPPAGWPAGSGTSQVLDFGMDPDIVNHSNPDIGGAATTTDALLALPSVVLTTELPNYFNIDGSQGFYSNPGGRGFAWERPVSVEWINPPDAQNPQGSSEFQIDAGVRARGGFSRDTNNPKHAFRLYFRKDYGSAKLDYPLFGRHGAQSFDIIDLRTSQNYSWSYQNDGRNTFLREEASRVAQLEMGQPGSRVRYVHVYLNGIYWGLFNLDERPEAAYAASYFGGKKSDYDVVKCEQESGYATSATDGSIDAWQNLWNLSRAHQANPSNENYFKMMGLATDGVTRIADPVLLDVDNLIDYLLLTFWTGNLDGCVSNFLGNDRANNWFGSRRATDNPGQGFRFFVHDFEHTFFNVNEDRTGPWGPGNQANFTYSNPYYLHRDLSANPEYQMRWADRTQKHLFQSGALTPTAWSNRINELANIVDQSIVAESARWGDAKRSVPFTKANWLNARNDLLGVLVPRNPIVLNQLRADGLYPAIDAPSITPFGGYQPSGVQVVMSGPPGSTLYYMADGSDPRAVGGSIRDNALTFNSAVTTETLIPWSASGWKYLHDNSDQGTLWREPAYDDSGWTPGTAELGYGDGDEATVIAPPTPRYATAYFRRTFELLNPEEITNLSLRIKYDDAYAVYLNGTRIAGDLPIDPAYDYFSGPWVEDVIATVTDIPASLLTAGTNLIAVEIHQCNATSSDLSMDFSLDANRTTSSTPLMLSGSGERPLRARAYQASDSTWSALSEATFLLGSAAASPLNLAFSEIMYRPADLTPAEIAAGFTDPEDFEFLEITNIGSTHADLRGLYIYDAVRFDFDGSAAGLTLAPGARILLVSNLAAFEFRYGSGHPVAGSYAGNLSNSGETITLQAADDSIIRQVSYSDSGDWPTEPDGMGYSLIAITPGDFSSDSNPAHWRPSTTIGGNPGTSDATLFPAWMAAHGQTSPDADSDGDGLSNLLEYALGGSPLTDDRALALRLDFQEFVVGGQPVSCPVLSHRQRVGADSVTVTLESSLDPATEWQPEGSLLSRTPHADGTETLVHRAAPTGDNRVKFWRLKASLRP